MGQDELSRLHEQAQAVVDAELAGVKAKHPSSDGLRKLADWLDKAHAEGFTPEYISGLPIAVRFYSFSGKFSGGEDDARDAAKALGTFQKVYDDHHLTLKRDFGAVEAEFLFPRERVCKRVVTGTKTLPAVTIPAKPAEPERVIPEQTIETVEWQCGESLLAKTFDELEATS